MKTHSQSRKDTADQKKLILLSKSDEFTVIKNTLIKKAFRAFVKREKVDLITKDKT